MRNSAAQKTETTPTLSQLAIARLTGGTMVAYMLAVAVQVATRTASTNSQVSFTQSLETIAANHNLYLTSMSANLVSSILLVALAAGLHLSLRAYQPYLALAGSFLFLAATFTWLMSAVGGVALASLAREFVSATGSQAEIVASSALAVDLVRETAGRAGFTLAALSVLSFGGLIAWHGALPRWLGWLGLVVGVLMLFIWYDNAAVLHRIGGTGYLLWLLITGVWLVVKGMRPLPESS